MSDKLLKLTQLYINSEKRFKALNKEGNNIHINRLLQVLSFSEIKNIFNNISKDTKELTKLYLVDLI